MNQIVRQPEATALAVELITCDGQRVMVPLYRLAEAHARLSPRRHDEIDLIQDICAGYFHLSPEMLRGDQRKAEIIHARHIAMYLARKMTEVKTLRICRRFDRDHSSISHAIRKVERLIDSDASVRRDVELLREAIIKAGQPA